MLQQCCFGHVNFVVMQPHNFLVIVEYQSICKIFQLGMFRVFLYLLYFLPALLHHMHIIEQSSVYILSVWERQLFLNLMLGAFTVCSRMAFGGDDR